MVTVINLLQRRKIENWEMYELIFQQNKGKLLLNVISKLIMTEEKKTTKRFFTVLTFFSIFEFSINVH